MEDNTSDMHWTILRKPNIIKYKTKGEGDHFTPKIVHMALCVCICLCNLICNSIVLQYHGRVLVPKYGFQHLQVMVDGRVPQLSSPMRSTTSYVTFGIISCNGV